MPAAGPESYHCHALPAPPTQDLHCCPLTGEKSIPEYITTGCIHTVRIELHPVICSYKSAIKHNDPCPLNRSNSWLYFDLEMSECAIRSFWGSPGLGIRKRLAKTRHEKTRYTHAWGHMLSVIRYPGCARFLVTCIPGRCSRKVG